MSNSAATILAAVILSSPSWAGIMWTDRRQRRRDQGQAHALAQQTDTLKAHITAATAGTGEPIAPDDPKERGRA